METGSFQAYRLVDVVPEETADSSQESSPTEAGPTSSRHSERFGRGVRLDTVLAHHLESRACKPSLLQPQRAPDGAPVHGERHRQEQATPYSLVRPHAVTFFAQAQAEGVLDLPQ